MTQINYFKPRYKSLADYPGCPYYIGEIIYPEDTRFLDLFPHLFKRMEWWEEMTPEQMPEYVKVNEDIAKDTGLFCKVYKWSVYDDNWLRVKGGWGAEIEGYYPLYLTNADFNFDGQVYGRVNAMHLLPATREEYEAYISTPC